MARYTNKLATGTKSAVLDEGLRAYLLSVYNYMTAALIITGLSAYATMSVDVIANLMFNFTPYGQIAGTTGFGMLIMLSPIGIAFYFFSGAGRMSVEKSQMLLWVYAGLTGMSLSSLGFVYTGESIARTFFIAASVFGAMSIYGYTTKRDLTSFGSFMVMGMFGLLIASLVNMFMQSSALYFVTSILGVFIFMGIIAWNTQRMKAVYFSVGGGEMGQKMAVVSAFSAYLDFINLFLYLIRFFGVARGRE
ncbi:MAG UNVERIFIED_CONTAM: Bax inhibitor-1/YccA family protein [Rickettsiaceae bacterium]|jgi:FtsH-binding integral membrane protein